MSERKGPDAFRRWVPVILEAVVAGDVRAAEFVRQAVATLEHWDLPIGMKVEGAWVGAILKKLESPNRYRSHWAVLNGARAQWERCVWTLVERIEGCAGRSGLTALGRVPHCTERMSIQIVRLVSSVREFIRDDDNLAYSRKGLTDSLKRVGLIKDDRREWLHAAPIVQDVSPLGLPVTVFVLRPAEASLFQERSHVHHPKHQMPHRSRVAADGGAEEGRAVGRVRRRAGSRTVDVGPGERTRS
jgi:hypothetical protein